MPRLTPGSDAPGFVTNGALSLLHVRLDLSVLGAAIAAAEARGLYCEFKELVAVRSSNPLAPNPLVSGDNGETAPDRSPPGAPEPVSESPQSEDPRHLDIVEEAGLESFPASDPPPWSEASLGRPDGRTRNVPDTTRGSTS
jgi:hypothetical protein